MTTRADLIETAYDALDGLLQHAQIKRRAAERVLDAVLPQVTTAEQLDALPAWTVVIDGDGDPWRRDEYGSWESWDKSDVLATYGPLTVVWQPQPEQETRADA